MGNLADILIQFVHVPLGGLALLAGAVSLIAQKGGKAHKRAGKVFFYAMLISAIAAMAISLLPGHESPFLFAIGVFSSYFIISGYRSLQFKKIEAVSITDKLIAYGILLTGLLMVLYPIVLYSKLNIILTVFGIVGFVFGVRDLRMYRHVEKLRQNWLTLHLGKITGGYIAAVSAFFVVNQILPGIWNWFAPSIIGSVYIAYWIRKVRS